MRAKIGVDWRYKASNCVNGFGITIKKGDKSFK
jgi:hypothetical protein